MSPGEIIYNLSTKHEFFHNAFRKIFGKLGTDNEIMFRLNRSRAEDNFFVESVEIIPFADAHKTTLQKLIKACADWRGSEYKLIPVTLDYNLSMYHQGMILIGKCAIVFYEPYGKYSKLGGDYFAAIKNVFAQVVPEKYMEGPNVKFFKYHALMQVQFPAAVCPTQSKILKYNNSRATEMNIRLAAVYDSLSSTPAISPPSLDSIMAHNTKEDHTVASLYAIDKLLPVIRDPKLKRELFDIYAEYTSKSCVSITIIEMNEFVTGKFDICKVPIVALNRYIGKRIQELIAKIES